MIKKLKNFVLCSKFQIKNIKENLQMVKVEMVKPPGENPYLSFDKDQNIVLQFSLHNLLLEYWLFLRDILEYEGVKSYSPVQVLEGCVKIGLIEDKEYWSDIFGKDYCAFASEIWQQETIKEKQNRYLKIRKYIPIIEDHFNTILKKYNLDQR